MTSSKCKTNMHKYTPIMETSTKYPTSKLKIFFFFANYKTFPIFGGFEQLSNSSGWRVMAKTATAITVAGADVKGLQSAFALKIY